MIPRSAALLFVALTTAHASHAPDLQIERRVASYVVRDEALSLVRELTGFGPRTGGTPSGDRASEAVATHLRRLGLPVTILEDPPWPTYEERSWEVSLDGQRLDSAWPYGFSPSLPPVTVRLVADTVEGPEGRVPAAAAGRTFEGAAVLTHEPAASVYAAAARQGAVALLTAQGTAADRYRDAAPIGQVPHPGGRPSPIPVFGLSWEDGLRLRRALSERSSVQVRLSLDATTGTGSPRTVVGVMPGSGRRRGELVVVCAHGDSDSGGPGADDNASGVASLLEVARALVRARDEKLLPPDRPEVRFIVWGAEYHSSEAWVKGHPVELARLVAVFNYDQTGTGAARDAVYFEGNDVPWNEPLLRLLERVGRDHAGHEGFWTAYTSNPSLSGTDAYAFLPKRYKGRGLTRLRIPSTTVFTSAWDHPTVVAQTPGWRSAGWPEPGDLFIDYSAVYHSSGDLPAATTEAEPWNMERCARLVVIAILRMMQGAAGPAPSPAN